MTSKTTRNFRTLLNSLPADIRDRANEAYLLFSAEPNHPSLRFKRVHSTDPIYSARVTQDYRVLGMVAGETVVWFWIGKHSEYEKLLAKR